MTAVPPTSEEEAASYKPAPIQAMGGGMRRSLKRTGGSLLASMSAAAYQLAPAAVLLGIQEALRRAEGKAKGDGVAKGVAKTKAKGKTRKAARRQRKATNKRRR